MCFMVFVDEMLYYYCRYWDEIKDVGKFFSSLIFDFVFGFGGSGLGLGNCFMNGFFVNLIVNIGFGFIIVL